MVEELNVFTLHMADPDFIPNLFFHALPEVIFKDRTRKKSGALVGVSQENKIRPKK